MSAICDYAADCQGFSRGVVAETQSQGFGGRAGGQLSAVPEARHTTWLDIAFLIAGLLV
jgi:hypothetical protein